MNSVGPAVQRAAASMHLRRVLAAGLAAAGLLAGCGSRPVAPAWQLQAHDSLARYQQAWLTGATRAAQADFARARQALAATGQPSLVARAELTRCALQVASLAFEPCPGFEALRVDAGEGERAYADYLQGLALTPEAVQRLPARHRAAASRTLDAAGLRAIDDPLARLVAAGVQVRTGRASPQTLAVATETASQAGWRRPLLAWLGAQARAAEQSGDAQAAQQLRRRMDLVGGEPAR